MASCESNTGKNMNVASDTNHSGSKNNKKKRSSSIDDGNIVVENVERFRKCGKCSKSECKNKYCPCYRFEVGCSLQCGCKSCKNMYGIKDSSSVAKEQEHANDEERANDQERDNNDDNGRKNEGTTDNGSSPESHHPVVDNQKKRSSSINDENRGCNCKKSKCMQLYCECLNAGNFCNNSCSCENCLNRVENKDSVNERKKEIELRDPRAFEPKTTVVENVARLSKGCNCGKSMCKKNYCGCFRYEVGCSLQCRCGICSNPYGTKDSASVAKEQERANNDNSGSKNEGTTVNVSSPESHHPLVDDNRLTQENKEDYYRRQMLLARENEFHNMPMPSNQVAPVPREGPAAAAYYYYYRVVLNRGAAPHYQPLTPPQISSVRNNITEQQNANMLGEPSWRGQSSFPRPLRIYYDNSAGPSSVQSSQQYQPHQSYGSHQQVQAPSGTMTWQRLFQPNNNDATNMQARPYPHLHGYGPSSKFLQQNNRGQ